MNENWSHDRCLLSRAFAGLKIHGKATLFFSLDQEQYDGPVVVVGQGGARRPGVPGEVLSGEDGPGRVQGEGLGVIQEWPGVPREAPSGGMV